MSTKIIVILLTLMLVLCACNPETLEIGIVPSSTPTVPIPTDAPSPTVPAATPTPLPLLPLPADTPTPTITELASYTNQDYYFSLQYPAGWTIQEKESHFVRLGQEPYSLYIGFMWLYESLEIRVQAQGEFENRGTVPFLDQELTRQVLLAQGMDKAVFYNGPNSWIDAGDLVFAMAVDDQLAPSDSGIDPAFQAAADQVVASITLQKAPEITMLDETWFRYTNYQLGFSIDYPRTMVHYYGSCMWNEDNGDHSYRPQAGLVPVVAIEDGDTVYLTSEYYHQLSGETKETQADGGTRTFFAECNAVTNNVDLLRDPDNHYQLKWEIVAKEIDNEEELDDYIKSRYGVGCSLGELTPSAQNGVFDVKVQGDGIGLPDSQCPLNYHAVLKYYPAGSKIVAWDIGQAYSFYGAEDFSVAHDLEMLDSFRFIQDTETAGEIPVIGWYGSVHSLPAEAAYDDYLSVLPEGTAQVGIKGASPGVENMIADMRDQEPPDKYAHFWGTLNCGVSDYAGCQLLVTHLRSAGPGPMLNPDPVDGWEGAIVTNSAWAQVDDAFVLTGEYPVHYGLWSEDGTITEQIESLRNSGQSVRLWGEVTCGVIDANGCQIIVFQLELLDANPSPQGQVELQGIQLDVINATLGSVFPAACTGKPPACTAAQDGFQFLTLVLTPDERPEQALPYKNLSPEILIEDETGTTTPQTMRSYDYATGKLTLGFEVPDSAGEFLLLWPDSDPIELITSQ